MIGPGHLRPLLAIGAWPSMRHPIALYHLQEGEPQNLDIKPEALALQVFGIQVHFLGNRKFVPPVHLSPAGEARHQRMYVFLGAQLDQVVLVEQGRPRTYEAHVSEQNTPELRKLVEATFAK